MDMQGCSGGGQGRRQEEECQCPWYLPSLLNFSQTHTRAHTDSGRTTFHAQPIPGSRMTRRAQPAVPPDRLGILGKAKI